MAQRDSWQIQFIVDGKLETEPVKDRDAAAKMIKARSLTAPIALSSTNQSDSYPPHFKTFWDPKRETFVRVDLKRLKPEFVERLGAYPLSVAQDDTATLARPEKPPAATLRNLIPTRRWHTRWRQP